MDDTDTPTVDELTPDMAGRWIVTTQGSTHVWDLDNGTYERRPGTQSRSGSFAHDLSPQPITRVDVWPKVGGQSLVWFDDPARPREIEEFRRSSTITRIELDRSPTSA